MRVTLFILFYLAGHYSTHAQIRTVKFSYRHFGTENGLTQNSVSDAVFDKNGYLWISIRTDNVFMYDGYRFTPCWFYENGRKFAFKSASLFCNSAGDVFIAHEKGIHVKKPDNGSFEQASKSLISRENEEITFIGEDNNGKIFFYRWQVGVLYGLKRTGSSGYATDSILATGPGAIYFDQSTDGAADKSFFWFSRSNDPAYYLFDIAKGKIIKKILLPAGSEALALLAVDSILYEVGKDLSLYRSSGDGWENIAGRKKFFQNESSWQSITFSNKKNREIFVNPGQQLYKLNHDFTGSPVEITNTAGKPFLSKGGITKILQQGADYLWLFTTAEGIYQLDIKPKKFEHFYTDDGALNFIRSVCKDESTGNIFAGLFYGGLLVYNAEGKLIRNVPIIDIRKEQWDRFCVNGISKLDDHNYLLWLNAGRGYVLNVTDWSIKSIINSGHAWEENRRKFVIDYAGFLAMGNNTFASGYKNIIYFFKASAQGIQIQDSIACSIRRPEGFYYSYPYFFYGGIGAFYCYHIQTKKIDSISLPLTTKVKWISHDKYGRLWVSTETGIAVLEKVKPENYRVVKILSTKDGLPNHYVYIAEPDDKGKMWCSSNKGIFSIDIDNYSVTAYNTVDGLQSEEFNTGAFSRDDSGNLYFGGINGLNFFNPASMKESGEAAPVHICFIGSGDSVLYQYPNNLLPSSVRLSYRDPSLLLRFSSLNYKTPGFNQYEYKLRASDGAWQDNGSNNELKLLLSPGEYSIQIRLKNLPLSAVQLKVYVQPPFYQTIWFAVLVIVAIAAIVALLVNRQNKVKYRKRIALLEMQQKIQLEKERIARDLHDNIGVQANAILYGAEQLQKLQPEEISLVNNLQSTARDMMQSLRETVWAMKNTNAMASDIWVRIISFCKQLSLIYKESKIHVEGEAPETVVLNSVKTLHIVLIIQEAINNAVRHAKAQKIVVKSKPETNGWEIIIADNGYGFDEKAGNKTPGGGFGLSNMRERAVIAEISLNVQSQLEKGTHVALFIPFEKKQEQ